jgi:twitching motility two-component system response regulator PilH
MVKLPDPDLRRLAGPDHAPIHAGRGRNDVTKHPSSEAAKQRSNQVTKQRSRGAMGIRRILIVDDSPTERHVLNDMLTRAGFEVVSSDSGEDAIHKSKQLKPDLILMDVVMPGLNGFQATRAISRDPETKSIPIIMCTSKSQETDKIWGLRQGARDYIVKPVNKDELIAKIKSIG